MPNLTDLGLRDTTSGLFEAKALIRRRRSELQMKIGVMEAELNALGKIEASVDASVNILKDETKKREAEKQKETVT